MSVEQLFVAVSESTQRFAKASGLHCKPGCGFCCTNPRMETTVAEMMPLAQHLWNTAQALSMLAVLEAISPDATCVNFNVDPMDNTRGSCKAYAYRPGICRLFGYCARMDKHGRKELVTCAVIKENYPHDAARAQAMIDRGYPAPMLNEHSLQVFGVDPNWGKELLPINQALAKAIERIGLMRA